MSKNKTDDSFASNQMMYSTIRMTCGNSVGTAFLFTLTVDDSSYPLVVTNKHVVNNKEETTVGFSLHLVGDSGEEEQCPVTWTTKWYFHPGHDLCFAFFNPLVEQVYNNTKKHVKYVTIGDDLIPSNEQLNQLSAVEEVIMVGYPNGLSDDVHNYPLFRHGYTSSHPGIDFKNEGLGVIDIAAFNGSSGSPVFIHNSGAFQEKEGVKLGTRLYFIGVLSSGATADVNGDIKIIAAPTSTKYAVTSRFLINLGYYIRSEKLLDFRDIIREVVNDGEKK